MTASKGPRGTVHSVGKAMELIERDYGRNAFYEMMERNLKTVEGML